ncbi:MAG: response regulator [Hyphomonadaceae bacterium]
MPQGRLAGRARAVFPAFMPTAKPLAIVIEDDAAAADALTLLLKDLGAEVVRGVRQEDLSQALGARASSVRWIITDFDIGPHENGVALAGRLAADAPDARVLVLSGDDHRAAAAASSAGFDIMSKPANAEAIALWLERR